MRILLVNAHGGDRRYGGAERYVRDLTIGLRARGHEVLVLSAFAPRDESGPDTYVLHRTDWRDDRLRRLRNHAGDVISWPWPRVEAVVREARPDLVHTSNLPGIGTGIWESAHRLGIPVVHTLHDYQLLCPRTTLTRRDGRPCRPHPLLCGLRTRRMARWAGAVRVVIAGSEHLLRLHRGLFRSADERLIRLPLAPADRVPPPHAPPAALGYLGALITSKGVRLLLEAAQALASEGVELRIAGEGPLQDEVEAADGVRYAGRVEGERMTAFLAACDLGVVPSLWEEPSGPPYVVCDWLAAGRPVLVTRRGGLAEAADLGGVVPFDASADALLQAVRRLRGEREWPRALSAVPTVDGDADVQRWLDAHESAYGAALGERASAVSA